MGATSIEWTDDSHNPIRARLRDAAHAGVTKGGYGSGVGHYCEKISSGCANCYSSTSQPRFGMPEFPGVQKGDPAVEVFLDEVRLVEPLSWKKPRKVFLCDMTDLFGPWVPDEWIDKIFAVMALTPHLTWQALTKRPERMAEYTSQLVNGNRKLGDAISSIGCEGLVGRLGIMSAFGVQMGGGEEQARTPWRPFPNVWLGTSVENQATANERIPHLLRCPAAVRFLSCEPLLEPVDLDAVKFEVSPGFFGSPLQWHHRGRCHEEAGIEYPTVSWVIVGGESGHGARPFYANWADDIRDQCRYAGVACFIKQMGSNARCVTEQEGDCAIPLKDKKGGDWSEWPEDLKIRQFPATMVQ